MRDVVLSAFLNALIASVPLVGLVWLAMRLSRRWLNAATRYSVWWIMFGLVVAAPIVYTDLQLPHAIGSKVAVARIARPAVPELLTELPVVAVTPAAPPAMKNDVFPLNVAAFVPSSRIALLFESMAALMLARLLFSIATLQRRRRQAQPAQAGVSQLVGRCLRRCGVRRIVRVGIIDGSASPMVSGPFRPIILLPAQLLTALDANELEQVCLHEAAHLARYDDFALILQCFIEALFVFNPLVYWIGRQIRLEREIACDDFVVGLTGKTKPYASCLAHVAELTGDFSSPVAAGVTDERSHLTLRIEMLLDKSRRLGARLLMGRLASFILALTAVVLACAKTPALFAFADVEKAPQPVVIAQAVTAPTHPQPVTTPVPRPLSAATLRFCVTDPLNRFVTGLDRDVFKVYEHGVERPISKFSGDADRVSIQIVWNIYEDEAYPRSLMAFLQEELAQALKIYKPDHPTVRELQKKIAVVTEMDASRLSGQELVEALTVKNPQDKFALVRVTNGLPAALIAAAENLKGDTVARQALLIVSGASVDMANIPAANVSAGLLAIHVPIYSISVGEPAAATSRSSLPPTALAVVQATRNSGGVSLLAEHLPDVPSLVNKVIIETRNQYELSTVAQGKSSDLEIRLFQPAGLPALTLKIGGRNASGPPGPR